METPSTREAVFNYLRAGYPALYLVTWEEQRTEAAILDAASDPKLKRRVLKWTSTKGYTEGDTLAKEKLVLDVKDPVAAIKAIVEKLPEDCVFIMRDFHSYLRSADVVRQIRDALPRFKSTGRTLVIESPVTNIPIELEKEITLFTVPLPTRDDISTVLDVIIDGIGAEKAKIEDRIALLESAKGLTLAEAENVFALASVKHGNLSNEAIATVMREAANTVKKSGVLEFIEPADSIESIGGLNNMKEYLSKRDRAFSDEARKYGLPTPRGLLLVGVQGCGKSLTAKAIARSWRRRLLRLDMGRLFAGLVGASEDNARKAIAIAEAVAPCVLWCDELEQGFAGAKSSGAADSGTTARVLGTFLTWMSDKTSPVYMVATSNDITGLPPQLYRKGRFDEIFFVDLPTQQERGEIVGIQLVKRQRDPKNFNIGKLAMVADQYSGAEIEQAIVDGMWNAFNDSVEVTTEHIEAAILGTKPLAITAKESIDNLREWAKDRARPATTVISASDKPRRMKV